MEKYVYRFVSVIVLSIAILSGCYRPQLVLPGSEAIIQMDKIDDSFFIIPFDLIDDKVLLDAEINDVKGKLCFEITRKGLQIDQKHFNIDETKEGALTLRGNHGFSSESSFEVQIGDLKANYATAQSLNSDIFRNFEIPVLAFVGRDLFSNAELFIDYNSKKITVFPLDETSPLKSIILIG